MTFLINVITDYTKLGSIKYATKEKKNVTKLLYRGT